MRGIFLFFACAVWLYAQTLQELIDKALVSATSLAVLEKKIEQKKVDEEIADLFENPTLALTKNTLPSNQAMSQTTVSVKQKIYWWGKREQKEKIATQAVLLEHAKLYRAKTALVATIKQQVYRIWELKRLLEIVTEYEALTKESEELYETYAASAEGGNHMGIMSAKLSLSELKIKKTRYKALLEVAKKRVSYLVNEDVIHVEIDLKMGELPKYDKEEFVKKNAELGVVRSEIDKKESILKFADTQNYPDFDVLATYAHRERFDDYLNVGISLSLPIYSKEDKELQKAKIAKLEAQKREADVENALLHRFEEEYALLQAQYEIYKIIKKDTMPQIEHMLEISESMIQSGTSLFEYIGILERKLKLEEQAVDAVTKFYIAKSKIEELRGDLK